MNKKEKKKYLGWIEIKIPPIKLEPGLYVGVIDLKKRIGKIIKST
jgi:hypothetical protein